MSQRRDVRRLAGRYRDTGRHKFLQKSFHFPFEPQAEIEAQRTIGG